MPGEPKRVVLSAEPYTLTHFHFNRNKVREFNATLVIPLASLVWLPLRGENDSLVIDRER